MLDEAREAQQSFCGRTRKCAGQKHHRHAEQLLKSFGVIMVRAVRARAQKANSYQ